LTRFTFLPSFFLALAMDLQAILDASDSDDESNGRSDSSHVDIERILREDDNDDFSDGENRNDITITSMSTIETNIHHFLPKKSAMRFEHICEPSHEETMQKDWYDRAEQGYYDYPGTASSYLHSAKYNNTSSHNAEEWAVLQEILGEDEDDGWMNEGGKDYLNGAGNKTVDEILQSMTAGEDEIDFDTSFVTSPIEASTSPIPIIHDTDHKFMLSEDIQRENSLESPHLTEKNAASGVSGKDGDCVIMPEVRAGEFSSNLDDEISSRNSLQYAIAYEKKLLRPGHREILSPLMVKRRLKPRIELGTIMQRKNNDQKNKFKEDHKIAQASNSANGPRFNFSGVLENKAMPSLSFKLCEITDGKKDKVGLPTALSVNSKFIAIGTQKGAILVFDLFEVLRHQLSNLADPSADGPRNGSVTSIDVSGNGEVLIAGYTSGVLVLWDVIKGIMLKTISDVHPSPISTVRFLNEKDMKVVTVDSGGLVNMLTFTRNILWSTYSMETDCLLDGTAGQILAMHVLPPPTIRNKGNAITSPKDPFLDALVLIALSSERSSFAIAVEPEINVLHRWAKPSQDEILPGNETFEVPSNYTFLPCLSWGWSLVIGGGNAVTPILARAWGCKLQFLRASFQSGPTENINGLSKTAYEWPAFGLHDEFDSAAPIVAVEWLGERSLAYLTLTNEFIVIDTVMMTMLERLNFSSFKLVYAEFSLSRSAAKEFETSAFEKQSNGRSCSTFQNSMRSSDNRLLLLCQNEVRNISILGAKQRISSLEEDGEWLEALALALDHYENTVKSQEDRQRVQGKKDTSKHPEFFSLTRSEDEEWIAKLLIRYFNLAVDNAPEADPNSTFSSQSSSGGVSRLDLAQSHFQMLAGVCVEFCVIVRRFDLLFGPIFRRFLSVNRVSVFLDVLEPYVLNDKLNYIAPEAMSHFVEHCKLTNGIAVVERCLLHMDVSIMDFDSIISLLRRNEMYSALFHVFTRGLNDFVTPLEIILERLFDVADEGDTSKKRSIDGVSHTQFEKFGYKAILYLQHCFNEKSFPQGTDLQPEEKIRSIRPQLLQFLQQESHCLSGNFKPDALVSSEPVGHRALTYPYMQLLLMVDARAMLDTVSIALDAPDSEFMNAESGFESIGGWEVEVGAEINMAKASRDGKERNAGGPGPERQQIITILSAIILPDENERNLHGAISLSKSKTAVNAFLDFMAAYLTKGVVRANKVVTYLIISRMVDRFRSASSADEKRVSQKEILELLTALPRNAYEPEHALRMIEDAGVHRAALLLHQQGAAAWHEGSEGEDRRSHHFTCAISCYLGDHDPNFRTEVFEYAKNECSGANTADDTDAKKLKHALLLKIPELVNLDAILSAQLVAELYIEQVDDVVAFLGKGEPVSQFKLLNAIISGDLSKVDVVSASVLSANLSMDHHQVYLALMASLHPDMVYDYLSTHDNYRPEECLKLCQQHDIADASAYLLEKMGNVSSALQLILQTFEGRMMSLKRTVRGLSTGLNSRSSRRFQLDFKKAEPQISEQESKQKKEVEGVTRILIVALDLCERNSGLKASNSEQGSQLWFNVLDRLINAKGFLRLSKEKPAHAEIIVSVLSDLLQLTMQRMVSGVPLSDLVRKVTTDNSGSRLGELREMIMSLLRTYGHETGVFSGAIKVMNQDVKKMEDLSHASKVRGCSIRSIMGKPLSRGLTKKTVPSNFHANNNGLLKIGVDSDATFCNGDRVLKTGVNCDGLASALDRLHSRRKPSIESDEIGSERQTVAKLSMHSVSEVSYYDGQSSESAMYSGLVVGNLGEAHSYGSLHWIHSS